MPEVYDAIYLSPHLDDAALSCGGQIARRAADGESVLVLTVFAGREPEPPHSRLATRLHRLFSLPRDVVETRRREDVAACEILGAEARHWNFREAIYRRDDRGRFLYTRLRRLFARPHRADEALVPELAAELRALLGDGPSVSDLVAPLGVGGHVDHRLVRRAAETCGTPAVAFYEELPYVERRRALRRALARRRDWSPRVVELTEGDLVRKLEACSRYGSQIAGLYGSPEGMEYRLREWAERVGGERLWLRRAAS